MFSVVEIDKTYEFNSNILTVTINITIQGGGEK